MHITLSRWLRDYLYVPLGGGRRGLARQGANLMITMGLGGLWHGAGWTYIAFGLIQGALLVVNHGWRALRRALGHDLKSSTPLGRWSSRALTFLVFAVSLVVFRAPTLDAAGAMYRGMAGLNGVVLFESYYGLLGGLAPLLAEWGVRFERLFYWESIDAAVIIAALIAVAWLAPNSQEIMARDRPTLDFDPRSNHDGWRIAWRPTAAWGVATGIVLFVAVQALFAVPPAAFIYFQY
jgi:D-alanyl-lipoteichoic acid acyltransferase DltB (MBOAT superfamily)